MGEQFRPMGNIYQVCQRPTNARIVLFYASSIYVAIYRSISTLITEPLAVDLNIYRLKRLLRGRF